MSILIKGMDMPGNCAECPVNMEVCKRGYKYLLEHPELYEKRANDCPLVEVKEPHGRLIDVDALIMQYMRNLPQVLENESDFSKCLIKAAVMGIFEDLENAPTIIGAEGKDDGRQNP